jgi:hypothetical protein
MLEEAGNPRALRECVGLVDVNEVLRVKVVSLLRELDLPTSSCVFTCDQHVFCFRCRGFACCTQIGNLRTHLLNKKKHRAQPLLNQQSFMPKKKD